MIIRILMVLTFLAIITSPVCAEYYKYRDANGILRFTDNLLEVPEDQRENIQAYQEAVTPEPEVEVEISAEEQEKLLNDRNSLVEQLNQEREVLEKTYTELEAERNTLLAASPSPDDQEAYEAHRKRIEDFNLKIKRYEEQRKEFQAKVDRFNAQDTTP